MCETPPIFMNSTAFFCTDVMLMPTRKQYSCNPTWFGCMIINWNTSQARTPCRMKTSQISSLFNIFVKIPAMFFKRSGFLPIMRGHEVPECRYDARFHEKQCECGVSVLQGKINQNPTCILQHYFARPKSVHHSRHDQAEYTIISHQLLCNYHFVGCILNKATSALEKLFHE